MNSSTSTLLAGQKLAGTPICQDLRFGVVGVGAIGQHHVRILSQLVGVRLVGVCEIDATRGESISRNARVALFESTEALLKQCDAVVISTPTATHYELALQAIASGKHVLIEKPLADTVERAHELAQVAKTSGSCCVVGHVERFNPVVRWFRQNIKPADVLSINIIRVGPRPPRVKDVGIVIDLAVHDIDLVAHICQSPIDRIQAICNSTHGEFEDVAQISMRTASGAVCGINTNWLTPYKSRRIEIATKEAFFVGDLVHGSVHAYQATTGMTQPDYPTETFFPSSLEPLVAQAASFVSYIRGEEVGENATLDEACKIVELADQCLRNGR